MNGKVIVVGFGSMGRRHVRNLIDNGVAPCVLTKYPDHSVQVSFVNSVDQIKEKCDAEAALICSPTANHLKDICNLVSIGIKRFLIEKPVERDIRAANAILRVASDNGLDIRVAYNMRYLPCFKIVREFINEKKSEIRIVTICAGQYLPSWRSNTDYRTSYSVKRHMGGGVDLDLSHEIDYMLWLFGEPQQKRVYKAKISSLELDAPDIFCGIYSYHSPIYAFVVTVQLDYIRRQNERELTIICEDGDTLRCDFIARKLRIHRHSENKTQEFTDASLFDFDQTYVQEVTDFLKQDNVTDLLATLDDSIKVIRGLSEVQDVQ
jgi:predicted dehydrogenase